MPIKSIDGTPPAVRTGVFRKFRSHAEAEAADDEFYRRLAPEQRMEIFCELMARVRDYEHEAATGFPRVSRVIKLPRS